MINYKVYEPGLKALAISYSQTEEKAYKQQLKTMIMKCLREIDGPFGVANKVSVKAKQLAEERGIDLTKMSWYNQPSMDKKRELFVYEHKDPINMVASKIINNPDDIISILEKTETVWVTREEDIELTRLGYWKNRPDPDLAYKEANIIIIDNS